MLRFASALAVLLTACGGTDASPPGPGDAPRPSTAVAASCQPAPAEARAAIEASALDVLGQLRAGDLDALGAQLHPQARREGGRDAFEEALDSMQRRLGSPEGDPEVQPPFLVDISGGASALARVRCGEGSPEAFTLLTNAGNEDVAVAIVRTDGDPFGYATTVQLRKHGGAWKLLGVNVGLETYRDRDAGDYERLADAYVTQKRTVEAYLVLALAQQLASRGASLKSDRSMAITDKLDAVANSREFQQQLGVWEVGGRRYDVQGFSVTATQSDLSAVVRYVTPTGLIQDALDQEADALLGHLEMQHPEIRKRFDAVVFEAYDSEAAAADPGEKVQAFRTARVFPEPVVENVPGKTSRPG